ncbi:hypothetical protein C2845_PM03G05630 [Panicum miliaceum]|uniref:G-type lectin S-receptor-like serine/threonine-protein kinase n=1 Tax=Panicum miliaceum TaxID=4540 RepID=A0A3L6T996_PANMI|nr:hypothetical protein C2845_PM03G05630 [Panicum miliaceum]
MVQRHPPAHRRVGRQQRNPRHEQQCLAVARAVPDQRLRPRPVRRWRPRPVGDQRRLCVSGSGGRQRCRGASQHRQPCHPVSGRHHLMAELRPPVRHVPPRHEDPDQVRDARRRAPGLVEGPRRPLAGTLLLRRGPRHVPPALRTWNGTRSIWRSGPWTGYMVSAQTTQYLTNTSAIVYSAVVNNEEEIYITFSLSDGAAHTRYVLTDSGDYQLQTWNSSSSAWILLGWTRGGCASYGYCGLNGYCDLTELPSACKCLDGFEPTSLEDWRSGRFSQGCRRKEALRCSDGFLALPGISSPDKFVLVKNRSLHECAAECTRNCSCVAYAYANLSTSRTKGDLTRCLVWTGELIDTMKVGVGDGSDTLYLRSAGLDEGKMRAKRRHALKTVLPAVLISGLLILAVISLAWLKFRGRVNYGAKHKKLTLDDMSASDELGEGNHAQDFEFLSVRFEDIVAATCNFSEACKIGQGGFGKVYKAMLGGQEVAIKRLSKDSEQGTKEFKNEVILIAKLQHRNLVRLLGCSVEADEKILIYEYLASGSLDATLFGM